MPSAKAVVGKIDRDIQEILAEKDIRAKFDGLGLEIIAAGPVDFEKRIRADFEEYGMLVRRLDLEVE